MEDRAIHEGVVVSIEKGVIRVSVARATACGACHQKEGCVLSDKENNVIEIYDPKGQFSVGEKVLVTLEQSSGYQALFLGYLVPFLILVGTLFLINTLTGREGVAAFLAVSALVPYYAALYFFQKRLQKAFQFTIHKLNHSKS